MFSESGLSTAPVTEILFFAPILVLLVHQPTFTPYCSCWQRGFLMCGAKGQPQFVHVFTGIISLLQKRSQVFLDRNMLHPSNNTIQLRQSGECCNTCITVVAEVPVRDQGPGAWGTADLTVFSPALQTFPFKLTSQILMLCGIISYTAKGTCAWNQRFSCDLKYFFMSRVFIISSRLLI